MIKLDVADYCQSCPDFIADVEKFEYGSLNEIKSVTTIRCENSDRCRNLVRHLKEELEVTEND